MTISIDKKKEKNMKFKIGETVRLKKVTEDDKQQTVLTYCQNLNSMKV